MHPDQQTVDQAVIAVARDAYGRLIAYLSARTRDIAASEDALADAFRSALESWPKTGVPPSPEAWLMLTARRRLIDGHRRARTQAIAEPALALLMDEMMENRQAEDSHFPDERLKLMFVCAHPAIEAGLRTPLILQTVLGLSAERIASSFLIRPATMAQRLSRAKQKIRDAGLGFEVPEVSEWPIRLKPLLEALYAAYGLGWGDYEGRASSGLDEEAITLMQLLSDLMAPYSAPDPELLGLLALIDYCEARKSARMTAEGEMIALGDQDTRLWDWGLIKQADSWLNQAIPMARPGRYQLEALIQAAHIERGVRGCTNWTRVLSLYEGLNRIAPSLASNVAYAAALCEGGKPQDGFGVLETLMHEPKLAQRLRSYQSYWATRAHILARLERIDEARLAYETAIGLSSNRAQRSFLRRKQAELDEAQSL